LISRQTAVIHQMTYIENERAMSDPLEEFSAVFPNQRGLIAGYRLKIDRLEENN
jgi:hypothetical protein